MPEVNVKLGNHALQDTTPVSIADSSPNNHQLSVAKHSLPLGLTAQIGFELALFYMSPKASLPL
jgi:hypothetical protein